MAIIEQSDISFGILPVEHLLILCCFGGLPFIDYFATQLKNKNINEKHLSTQLIDPTDWIAVDLPGKLKFKTHRQNINK